MSRIRVLAVDDEKPARERLRRLLERDQRIELVACCASGVEAVDAVRTAAGTDPVQLILADVQMPEVDGFGVLARLRDVRPAPAVIFVTAYDEHAIRAFDVHAIDYLLKPFSDERFEAALDRAIGLVRAGRAETLVAQLQELLAVSGRSSASQAGGPRTDTAPTRPANALDRIVLKSNGRIRLLPVEQITWIEAAGVYVKLHLRDGSEQLHRSLLGDLDDALDARRFVRVHRSAIVNLDVVDELQQDPHGDLVVVLRTGARVRLGRRYRLRLQERLGQPL